MFVFTIVAYIALTYVVMTTKSYLAMVISFYLLGFFMGPKTGVGWPYLLELIPKQSRAAHAAAFGVLGGLMAIIGTFYFLLLTKDAYYLMMATFISQILTLIVTMLLPESPLQLFF